MHIQRWPKLITLILALILLPAASFASVEDLKQNLEAITATLSSDVGVEVQSLDKKGVLFSRNGSKILNPASATKLVTTAAALRYLGPDYRFHTEFYQTSKGDLFIVGKGDPSIIIEELRMIADNISRNVKSIRHVVVNDSYFKSYTQEGLPVGKESYNSYTGALSLNFNRIRIKVRPAAKVGEDAKVEADSGNITIPVENEVETVSRGKRVKIELLPPPSKDGKEIFTVKGSVRVSSKGFRVEKHVSIPPLYFAETLRELLKQRGVKISGEIFTADKINGSKLIYDYESKPLSLIVKDMNKFSNNFIAEQLVKVLGAELSKSPGTSGLGVAVLKKYMSSLGFAPVSYVLKNGSGLTYDNRMTAAQLVAIIQDMYKSKKTWHPFFESLPIWGRDGTLRRRKKSVILKDKARAKTGSLDFVRAIAGVVPSAGGENVAFAILMNGGSNMNGFRGLQEKIIEAVARFRR